MNSLPGPQQSCFPRALTKVGQPVEVGTLAWQLTVASRVLPEMIVEGTDDDVEVPTEEEVFVPTRRIFVNDATFDEIGANVDKVTDNR